MEVVYLCRTKQANLVTFNVEISERGGVELKFRTGHHIPTSRKLLMQSIRVYTTFVFFSFWVFWVFRWLGVGGWGEKTRRTSWFRQRTTERVFQFDADGGETVFAWTNPTFGSLSASILAKIEKRWNEDEGGAEKGHPSFKQSVWCVEGLQQQQQQQVEESPSRKGLQR